MRPRRANVPGGAESLSGSARPDGRPATAPLDRKIGDEKRGNQTQLLHGAGIFTYMFPKNHPNVGEYAIHGASGKGIQVEAFS